MIHLSGVFLRPKPSHRVLSGMGYEKKKCREQLRGAWRRSGFFALGSAWFGERDKLDRLLGRRILSQAGISTYKDHGGNTETNSRGGAWVGCGHSPRMFHTH